MIEKTEKTEKKEIKQPIEDSIWLEVLNSSLKMYDGKIRDLESRIVWFKKKRDEMKAYIRKVDNATKKLDDYTSND